MSGVLLWVMGGATYHAIEYQLFYVDLRNDAGRWATAATMSAAAVSMIVTALL